MWHSSIPEPGVGHRFFTVWGKKVIHGFNFCHLETAGATSYGNIRVKAAFLLKSNDS